MHNKEGGIWQAVVAQLADHCAGARAPGSVGLPCAYAHCIPAIAQCHSTHITLLNEILSPPLLAEH